MVDAEHTRDPEAPQKAACADLPISLCPERPICPLPVPVRGRGALACCHSMDQDRPRGKSRPAEGGCGVHPFSVCQFPIGLNLTIRVRSATLARAAPAGGAASAMLVFHAGG